MTHPSSGGTEDSMPCKQPQSFLPADVREELPLWVGQLSTLRHISSFDRLFTTSTVPCVVVNSTIRTMWCQTSTFRIRTTLGVLIAPLSIGVYF